MLSQQQPPQRMEDLRCGAWGLLSLLSALRKKCPLATLLCALNFLIPLYSDTVSTLYVMPFFIGLSRLAKMDSLISLLVFLSIGMDHSCIWRMESVVSKDLPVFMSSFALWSCIHCIPPTGFLNKVAAAATNCGFVVLFCFV